MHSHFDVSRDIRMSLAGKCGLDRTTSVPQVICLCCFVLQQLGSVLTTVLNNGNEIQ